MYGFREPGLRAGSQRDDMLAAVLYQAVMPLPVAEIRA
jgi:hypothetical protein